MEETIKKKYKPKRCPHNKYKSQCKECGGSSICKHGRRKTICKECGGGSICIHGRENTKCKECYGGSRCEHKKIKSSCKNCEGGSICQHKRAKSTCKECCGGSVCIHRKLKPYCKICGGSALCKTAQCETRLIKKYNGYCLPCCIQVCPDKPVARNYKTKEKDVVDRIKESFPNLTWIADKKVQDGCSSRRPDLLLDMGSHIIIVEIDENKHTVYDCSCEHKRLMQLSQDLQHRPIVFIRFNPDSYTNQAGETVKSCWRTNGLGVMVISKTKQKEWEERNSILKQQIQYWITNPNEKMVEIVELFY